MRQKQELGGLVVGGLEMVGAGGGGVREGRKTKGVRASSTCYN